MTFDQIFASLDVVNATPAEIRAAIAEVVRGIEQRASQIAADAIRADDVAKTACDSAQAAANDLERQISELAEQLAASRTERGEALASGLQASEIEKAIKRLSEQRDRAEDELAARKARIAPLRREALVAHAAALAARRAAIAELAREANAMAEDAKRRAGIAWEFAQAMQRTLNLYSAGWQRAHSAVAEHDAKESAA